MRKKNKAVAFGTVLKKCWCYRSLLPFRETWYKYAVKVPNVEETMTFVYDDARQFMEGATVKVEYDPEKPKKCKLIID
jgi:hypothetical protein